MNTVTLRQYWDGEGKATNSSGDCEQLFLQN